MKYTDASTNIKTTFVDGFSDSVYKEFVKALTRNKLYFKLKTVEPAYLYNEKVALVEIPTGVVKDIIRRVVPHPLFITTSRKDDGLIIFTVQVMHLNTAPSVRMARFAFRAAIADGDICPITLEPISEVETISVAGCGHVVSGECAFDRCPICRAHTRWTAVSRSTYGL